MKKILKKELNGWGGLDYLVITDVPVELTQDSEELIDANVLQKMEQLISEQILLQQLPICGQEVIFLRKALGLSRRKFAREVQLSDVAILKWEREAEKRLTPTSEILIRAYFSKRLELSLDQVFSSLFTSSETPKELRVSYRARPRKKAA
jgi:DNA-binding transcriptional regulator YiaG